jgi:hypothetical protein
MADDMGGGSGVRGEGVVVRLLCHTTAPALAAYLHISLVAVSQCLYVLSLLVRHDRKKKVCVGEGERLRENVRKVANIFICGLVSVGCKVLVPVP